MDAELRPTLADVGLGQGDFGILAALRRAGPAHSRTAGELRAALMVTSGAITKQVDRLAAEGLVTREVGGDDARVRRVTLTSAGVALVDELIEVHLAGERQAGRPDVGAGGAGRRAPRGPARGPGHHHRLLRFRTGTSRQGVHACGSGQDVGACSAVVVEPGRIIVSSWR